MNSSDRTERTQESDSGKIDLNKLFTEWSDDEDADIERSSLLKEYDRTHIKRALTNRPQFDNQQPNFHEQNRTFTEAYCGCCVGER